MDVYTAANLANWNDRAELHATDTTGSYRIDKVLAGGSSLHELETREIGDVSGKHIVHLQCHIGLDTLSLKHLGAASVTGLDFSSKALAAARDFAARAGTKARFVEASIYDAPRALGETYDMAFVTWGAINWLDDIRAWARAVAGVLKPGGRLYLLDGHPQMLQYEARNGRLELEYGWRTPMAEPLHWDDAQTYTGDERPVKNGLHYEWIHPIGDVVNALITAGMSIDFLNEHEIVVWRAFPDLVEAGEDQFVLPAGMPRIPMSFSIGATRKGP
ncbi:class I SAM-dependent methyltransferase [Aquamicrobium sp. LC103]|uniref:class I SAM-dependent methyltransferase n=1 Tax=Aquamicrobium sp. LC103 TaxID=1120658 RepID=UPI00063E9CD4|nr:class I SAM-dependent methyltransferase [Aquamicrobium sp. LC103]TKT82845.1 class I SAM-dependent methyltransferase [Aquamicrobium sp. LC103]